MSLTFVAIFHVLLLHFLFHHCICFQYYCSNSKYIPICLQYLSPGKRPLIHQPLIKRIMYIFISTNMAEICRFEKMNIHTIVITLEIEKHFKYLSTYLIWLQKKLHVLYILEWPMLWHITKNSLHNEGIRKWVNWVPIFFW